MGAQGLEFRASGLLLVTQPPGTPKFLQVLASFGVRG